MTEKKSEEQKIAEEGADEGVQVGRKEGDVAPEQNPLDDHGTGGASQGVEEGIGSGPSGGGE